MEDFHIHFIIFLFITQQMLDHCKDIDEKVAFVGRGLMPDEYRTMGLVTIYAPPLCSD